MDLDKLDPETRGWVEQILDQGYAIREEALPADVCDRLVETFEGMAGAWDRVLVQDFHGRRTVRYFDLLNGPEIFTTLPTLTTVLPVVRGVLGRDCLLATYGSVAIGPGERAQAIHADDTLYRMARPHPTIYCNVMFALTDFTEANGATRVIPGSHRWPENPEVVIVAEGDQDTRYETIAAEMPKGSVCFFLGQTYHGGGANTTGTARHGITMAFCAGWLRPQENFMAAVSQERAATFDRALQDLMGWRTSTGPGRLGHIYTDDAHLSGPLAHRLQLEGPGRAGAFVRGMNTAK
jgi:ectoine hydroxylase-related dioxygenase (phytanoyl-CoA dioxygenase family)